MENVLIYDSIFKMTEVLTDEQAGKLFKAINLWKNNKEVTFDDLLLTGIWMGIKPNLDNLKKNYDKKLDSSRENGKKGGRPPKVINNTEETDNTQPEEVETPVKSELPKEDDDTELNNLFGFDDKDETELDDETPLSTFDIELSSEEFELHNGLLVKVPNNYLIFWVSISDRPGLIKQAKKESNQYMFNRWLSDKYEEKQIT